jgi:hypothetical protein
MCDRQRREREQCQGEEDIEVERQIQEVEIPGFGPVQIGPTGWVGENVIAHNVPKHCSELPIEI